MDGWMDAGRWMIDGHKNKTNPKKTIHVDRLMREFFLKKLVINKGINKGINKFICIQMDYCIKVVES
jgi:hypothetical protein